MHSRVLFRLPRVYPQRPIRMGSLPWNAFVPTVQFFPRPEIDITFDDICGTFQKVRRIGQVMVFEFMKAKKSNESLFAVAMIAY